MIILWPMISGCDPGTISRVCSTHQYQVGDKTQASQQKHSIAICAMVKSRYSGDGHPTFNRNPSNGYINPYYWVDDHPLLYGNNGSLDPGTSENTETRVSMKWNLIVIHSVAIPHPSIRKIIPWDPCNYYGRFTYSFTSKNQPTNAGKYTRTSPMDPKVIGI